MATLTESIKKSIVPEYRSTDEMKDLINEMDEDLQMLIRCASRIMKKLEATRWGVISPAQLDNEIRVIQHEYESVK